MKDKLNLAVVGCGKYGTKRAQALFSMNSINIYCAVDSCSKTLDQDIYSQTRKYKKVEDIEDFDEIDLFIISTPNYTHSYLIEYLLKRNANILCEKPLCITKEELDSIEKMNALSLGSLFMGTNLSYFPSFLKVMSYIRANGITDFQKIDCAIGHNNKSALSEWNLDVQKSGGGTLIDNGIHLIYFVSQFLDQLEVVEVQGEPLLVNSSVESEVTLKAHSKNCRSINLTSSWSREVGYANITLVAKSGVVISADAFDDFIKVDGKIIEVDQLGKSLDLELADVTRRIINGKSTNLKLVKKTLNFIFDCYENMNKDK